MLCDTCRFGERPGFIRVSRARQRDDHTVDDGLVPCPDCGGQGIAHCCDGICEQPQSDPANNAGR